MQCLISFEILGFSENICIRIFEIPGHLERAFGKHPTTTEIRAAATL